MVFHFFLIIGAVYQGTYKSNMVAIKYIKINNLIEEVDIFKEIRISLYLFN
jgi:hypothetical protein